jgi:hypothetical protein
MGSYLSRDDHAKKPPTSPNGAGEWFQYLRKKVWAWIIGGILLMYLFFHIAQGLIVVIGGSALGLFLYQRYEGGSGGGPDQGASTHTANRVWSAFRGTVDNAFGNREQFDNYDREQRAQLAQRENFSVGRFLWRNTR